MNMNSNIKCGTSINGGVVLTDMPIDVLKAMRDSIDDAIREYAKNQRDKYITDIQAAIDAARDAGYEVYINEEICEDDADICLIPADEDDDDWDDDDDDDDPCDGCEDNCAYCHYHY